MLRITRLYHPRECDTVAHARRYATPKKPRDYAAAVQALNGLQSNFSIVEAIRKLGPGANKTAIPEMPSDFDRLNPIHIAGTKGKGSTASFISSILHQYLHKSQVKADPYSGIGLYTSPHLRFVRERIQIDNTPIAEELFAQQRVNAAVIECGIGGEKDVPAFTTQQPAAALKVLQERAEQKGTALQVVPLHPALDEIELGISGDFQKLNASLAIAICFAHLKQLGFSDVPHPLSQTTLPQAFVEGLKQTRLGGRCEMRPDPKEKHLSWYIDGGHTLESVGMAGRWFASQSNQHDAPKVDRVLIFNQQTRNASSLAKELYDTLSKALSEKHPFRHAIFCSNTTYKGVGLQGRSRLNKHQQGRRGQFEGAARTGASLGSNRLQTDVHVVGTIEEAVLTARRLCVASDRAQVLATGSLHLVGGLIEVLETEAGESANL
ncbi:hypothetical protein MRB53_041470 [Persea americana]|nr:hypothetical protein MRB53_041470 [Persea americana]